MSLFQSIKGRLLIFSLCISLIPIFAITTMGYFHATRTLKKQTLEWLTAVAESRKIHAQSFMEAKCGRAVDFGSDGFIRDTLETINRGGAGKGNAVIALSDYLSLEKWSLDPFITAIAVVDKGGRVVASTRKKIIGLDASGWEPFKGAINKKYHQTYISKPRNSPYLDAKCMFISTPVTSRKGGDTIGVIINAYDIVVLSLITANRAGMGETGEVYLVNSDGIMLTESRFTDGAPLQQVVDTEPIRKIAGGGGKMAGVYPDYRGVYIVGAAVYMPEYDWTLLAEIDQAEVFAPLRALRIVALVVGLISVVIVVRVGVSFAASESRPIEELVDATRRLANGDLEHRVDINRKDEIGVLADSFNTMADELAGEIAVRKRGEEELRKLSSAVVQSPSTVIITDPEGNIEYVNPKFTQLTGYTTEEVIGKNPRILKSGKIPPEVYKDLWETITAGGEWRGEFCNKKKNGEFYWEYASISPVRNTDGDITHFVAVKEDITERKRVEGALKESEEIFRNIGSSAQDAIIMADNGGHISYWNKAAEKLFDYSKDTAIGKDLHELIIPEKLRENHLNGFKAFRDTGQGPAIGKTLELTAVRKDGTEFPIELSLSGVKTKGKWSAIGIVRDITERKRTEEIIKHMAYHDALTTLPTRRLFSERLILELTHARRDKNMLAVMFLDLDRFKGVNDTLGHTMGDRLLKEIAVRLKNSVRECDTVSRMGGDEFTLLLPGIDRAESAAKIAGKILDMVKQPVILDGNRLNITTSIGVALYPTDSDDAETLLKNADAAMYRAKEQGRNNVQFFGAS